MNVKGKGKHNNIWYLYVTNKRGKLIENITHFKSSNSVYLVN